MAIIEYTIDTADENARLDAWCKQRGLPYHLIQKWCRKGAIKVNGKKAKAEYRLQKGDMLRVPEASTQAVEPIKHASSLVAQDTETYLLPHVLHQTKEWVLLNKPRGLASQGGTGIKMAVDMLCKAHPDTREWRLVHRLDKDTSGLLLLAKHAQAAKVLTSAFRTKEIAKDYLAITVGVPHPKQGRIVAPLAIENDATQQQKTMVDEENGKSASTEYEVLAKASQVAALVKLSPITGRKHQIRVHLQAVECPILGDGKYGGREAFIDGLPNHMHLHAFQLTINGKSYQAPVPDDFLESATLLGLEDSLA